MKIMPAEDLRAGLLDGPVDPLIEAVRAAPLFSAQHPMHADLALFEPRMHDRQGHFALLASHYLALAGAHGLSGAVFHHRGWLDERNPDWHGLFPVPDHFVGAGFDVDAPLLDNYTTYFREALEAGLRATGARIAVFPTARFLTLPGIAEAVRATPTVRAVIIGVMETWPVPDCPDRGLVDAAFQGAARTLADAELPVVVFAESEVIAEDLRARGFSEQAGPGIAVHVAPYPAAARLAHGSAEKEKQDALPRFVALGATRPVHNPGLLAEYLVSDELAPGQWHVRLNEKLAGDHLHIEPADLLTRLDARGIRQLPRQLDQETYDQWVLDADVMLLPYGERYESIGSGIFLECVCAGVIPLVPAASTMRALYDSLGGMAPAIDALSTTGIADAVNACARELPGLQENALRVRDAWLNHPHGPRHWERRVAECLAQTLQV
jgi:hypothetical protein